MAGMNAPATFLAALVSATPLLLHGVASAQPGTSPQQVANQFAEAPENIHHPYTFAYDNRLVELAGKIVQVRFEYPYSRVVLDVPSDSGDTTTWDIETFPAFTLRRAGWDPDTLSEGDWVRVIARPSLEAADRAQMVVIHRPSDGWTMTGQLSEEDQVPAFHPELRPANGTNTPVDDRRD